MAVTTLNRLLAEIKAEVEKIEADQYRLNTIKATIRVNALRHGATTDEVEAFVAGDANFITFICDVMKKQPHDCPVQKEGADRIEALTMLLGKAHHLLGEALFLKDGIDLAGQSQRLRADIRKALAKQEDWK